MIHKSTRQNIIQIKRQWGRAIRVTLDQDKATTPIHVISTYSPHSGHIEETRQHRWQDVQELLNKTSKRHLIIWGADAGGQLGNRSMTGTAWHERQEGKVQNIVGHTQEREIQKM